MGFRNKFILAMLALLAFGCGQEAAFNDSASTSRSGGSSLDEEGSDADKDLDANPDFKPLGTEVNPDGGEDSGQEDGGDGTDAGEDGEGDDDGGDDQGDDGGDDGKDDAGDDDDPTKDDVIETCMNATPTVMPQTITFAARQDCQWGTNAGGTEVLSGNGNLSIKDGWIRAREEQSVELDIPKGAILCGINLVSQTNAIHFDDFFALRLNQYMVAASKVLANATDQDADGHHIWDWAKIRGDGSEATGTRMEDLGKYCGTGDCDLPEHDTPGDFAVTVELTDDTDLDRNAALFAKLSAAGKVKFTATATGDNDAADCYHSGGDFDVELIYVE